MKKIMLLVFSMLLLTSVHAVEKVTPLLESSFQQQFPGAKHATWNKINNTSLYSVRFVHHCESMVAYFDTEGEYIALVRITNEEHLPGCVQSQLKKLTTDGRLQKLEELHMNGETSYIVELEKEGASKVIHLLSNGKSRILRSKSQQAAIALQR